jgi:hypothetical protein
MEFALEHRDVPGGEYVHPIRFFALVRQQILRKEWCYACKNQR